MAGERQRRTVLTAGFAGNVVEWYDFALYGFMASVFSRIFFPEGNELANLIAVYGIFAAGFVMRPLGSVVFGWLGDKVGRSRTMMISVALMAIPTFCLGLLPDYQAIGLAAPVMLVCLRLIQGLSVGGEFSTSVVYLVETAPDDRRGLSGSMANLGSVAGTAFGSLMAMGVLNLMPETDVDSWGWRIPYLLGGVIGIAALWLRRRLPKSPAFERQEAERQPDAPIWETLSSTLPLTLKSTLFAAGYGMFFYVAMVYFPNWLDQHGNVSIDAAMRVNTAALVAMLPVVLLAGWVSDRLPSRRILAGGTLGVICIAAWPAFGAALSGGLWVAGMVQFLLAGLLALLLGSAPALFAEIFPATNRNTGYSISFALGMGIMGGATPMLATSLIKWTGAELAPALMLVAGGLAGALAVWSMPERTGAVLQARARGVRA